MQTRRIISRWRQIFAPRLLEAIGMRGIAAVVVWPFVIFNRERIEDVPDHVVRHEAIHLMQAAEMMVVPFYVAYLLHYAYLLLVHRDSDTAYRRTCFEREAYENQHDTTYVGNRRPWSWVKYI